MNSLVTGRCAAHRQPLPCHSHFPVVTSLNELKKITPPYRSNEKHDSQKCKGRGQPLQAALPGSHTALKLSSGGLCFGPPLEQGFVVLLPSLLAFLFLLLLSLNRLPLCVPFFSLLVSLPTHCLSLSLQLTALTQFYCTLESPGQLLRLSNARLHFIPTKLEFGGLELN